MHSPRVAGRVSLLSQHVALGVAYHGGHFSGLQRQAHAASVQSSLEAAVSKIADQPITTHAAGRTDAGVHATSQVFSFTSEVRRPLQAWRLGVNAHVPPGVQVRWVREVTDDFHARFSAVARRYQYLFLEGPAPPQLADCVAPVVDGVRQATNLNDAAMHRAAQWFLGEQDFSAVRAAGCQSRTPMRNVHHARVSRVGPYVVFDVAANAFLLRMVRNMAALLLVVGLQQEDAAWVGRVLAGGVRAPGLKTADAAGLYLVDVTFPQALTDRAKGGAWPQGELPPPLLNLGDLRTL